MPETSIPKYHILMRIMHWLMAILILGMIAVGWYMVGLQKDAPIREVLYFIHKSFGVTVLFLVILRVILRLFTTVPALPDSIPVLERKAAHLAHYSIYLFMFIVPITGYMMSNMFGRSVSWFGITMPQVFASNRELGGFAREMHEILPYVFLAVIFLHAAGALKHRFFDKNPKNDVLSRML